MQPYVIRQGDYVGRLAYELGFEADAVWNDPANDDLRQIRSDPNILWPTDVLYVPTPAPPETHDLVAGSTNSFVADAPTTDLHLQFSDPALASKPVTIAELPDLTGLTTGGDGALSVTSPSRRTRSRSSSTTRPASRTRSPSSIPSTRTPASSAGCRTSAS